MVHVVLGTHNTDTHHTSTSDAHIEMNAHCPCEYVCRDTMNVCCAYLPILSITLWEQQFSLSCFNFHTKLEQEKKKRKNIDLTDHWLPGLLSSLTLLILLFCLLLWFCCFRQYYRPHALLCADSVQQKHWLFGSANKNRYELTVFINIIIIRQSVGLFFVRRVGCVTSSDCFVVHTVRPSLLFIHRYRRYITGCMYGMSC